ncbi:MarR family winged helix-turn-helix transcriptional regulator [Aminobacter sp. Piv2-1]|uniref:MarR family winged helix-turn-helix transcriptional regulator n=1 Tax=Aminobacter sp. Piv2-1 TaxID=3031122 RepID=UPI0030B3C796
MRAQRLLAQEIERGLQREFGISKAEFSVLVALLRASGPQVRVMALGEALGWEKSRVSHQLTRMESRGLVERTEGGTSGRRTGIGLTTDGRHLAESAILGHLGNVRRFFLDPLSPEQAAAIRAWSESMIDRVELRGVDTTALDAGA